MRIMVFPIVTDERSVLVEVVTMVLWKASEMFKALWIKKQKSVPLMFTKISYTIRRESRTWEVLLGKYFEFNKLLFMFKCIIL